MISANTFLDPKDFSVAMISSLSLSNIKFALSHHSYSNACQRVFSLFKIFVKIPILFGFLSPKFRSIFNRFQPGMSRDPCKTSMFFRENSRHMDFRFPLFRIQTRINSGRVSKGF